MSLIAQTFDKRVEWSRLYDWDFSPFDEFSLSPVETGISVISVVLNGPDSALTLGTPVVNGLKVQMLISGGTVGAAYTITVSVATLSHGYDLDLDGIINVLP